jgi:hypothetical protein
MNYLFLFRHHYSSWSNASDKEVFFGLLVMIAAVGIMWIICMLINACFYYTRSDKYESDSLIDWAYDFDRPFLLLASTFITGIVTAAITLTLLFLLICKLVILVCT